MKDLPPSLRWGCRRRRLRWNIRRSSGGAGPVTSVLEVPHLEPQASRFPRWRQRRRLTVDARQCTCLPLRRCMRLRQFYRQSLRSLRGAVRVACRIRWVTGWVLGFLSSLPSEGILILTRYDPASTGGAVGERKRYGAGETESARGIQGKRRLLFSVMADAMNL